MKTLEDIRGRCRIDADGHWIWTGAVRPNGRPTIHAPDYTKGGMCAQCGPRAVWHCLTGRAIPPGHWVYGLCEEKLCLCPKCITCCTPDEFGHRLAESGAWKGKTNRILANRAIGRRRSRVTAELIAEIQASAETGLAIARRLNLSQTLVSKARTGQCTSHAGGGLFAGLLR